MIRVNFINSLNLYTLDDWPDRILRYCEHIKQVKRIFNTCELNIYETLSWKQQKWNTLHYKLRN